LIQDIPDYNPIFQKVKGNIMIVNKKIDKKAEKEKRHYVDNKSFYTALIKHRTNRLDALVQALPPPRIPEYIGRCILQIATRLASKGNFVNYSYKEEMISDGIEYSINYLNNFDPEKSNNPFAYFTRIIFNAYIMRIHKEKKQTYIKYKSYENAALSSSFSENDPDFADMSQVSQNENMNVFVSEYERKMQEKKDLAAAAPKKGVEKFVTEGE
jgi:hypothetical protein